MGRRGHDGTYLACFLLKLHLWCSDMGVGELTNFYKKSPEPECNQTELWLIFQWQIYMGIFPSGHTTTTCWSIFRPELQSKIKPNFKLSLYCLQSDLSLKWTTKLVKLYRTNKNYVASHITATYVSPCSRSPQFEVCHHIVVTSFV